MDKTLRTATTADLPQLAELAAEFYGTSKFLTDLSAPHFVKFWEDVLCSNLGILFLLLEEDRIVGALGAIAHRQPYNDSFVAQECALFIIEKARGGIGLLRLIRAFEKFARERGCSRIRIGYLHDSMPERLAQFYRRMGFEPEETMFGRSLTSKSISSGVS